MKRVLVALLAALIVPAAQADEALWAKLKAGGNVVLVRHASTEGGQGDPPGFRLGDCATQRNLSEAGLLAQSRNVPFLQSTNVPCSVWRGERRWRGYWR